MLGTSSYSGKAYNWGSFDVDSLFIVAPIVYMTDSVFGPCFVMQ